MQTNTWIVILTTSFGAGHLKAAQAIEQAVRQSNSAVQTKLLDSLVTTAPRLTGLIMRCYLRIIAFMPLLYGLLYGWGNCSKTALWGRKLLSMRLAVIARRQLAAFPPQAVICTHASPAGAVCYLKKQGLLVAPIIAVVTDFVVHRLWIYDEVDIYAVAHEMLAQKLIDNGVNPAKIRITGIPIAAKFSCSINKVAVRRQLGLVEGLPVILIMGGGTGALPLDRMAAEFSHSSSHVQLLVVAGHNKPLRERLSGMAKNMPITVFGFVDNIHELMAVSDVIITKPGGLSTAEALAMGIPMVLFRPIPGQEEGNARFLINAGAACYADDVQALPSVVEKLLQDCAQLQGMRRKAAELAKPDAAQAVAVIAADIVQKSS